MLTRLQPVLGAWYEDRDRGVLFEVVDIDNDTGFVAVQYFEGELEELDVESFLRMPLRPAAQPEDWTGPYELDGDALDDAEPEWRENQWNRSLDAYDRDSMQLLDD